MGLYVTIRLAACRDARTVRPLTFLLTIDKYTGEHVSCFAVCRDARLVRPLTFLLKVDKYTGEQVACFAVCRDARLVRPLQQSCICAFNSP